VNDFDAIRTWEKPETTFNGVARPPLRAAPRKLKREPSSPGRLDDDPLNPVAIVQL
jgi:hypothetical protein